MVSVFTPNIGLEEPARGDYVGTWDTPVNANMTLIDLVAGGRTTISAAAGNVTLAAAQYECNMLTFNSTLLASISVTFPTSFTKPYSIFHNATGSSLFTITLQTTAAGGQAVCCPPGEIVDIVNDGTNIKFRNLGRVGSYMDWAGSSTPSWISGCTVPPYLYCNAGTFSSATYPVLATILGSTTLPDYRGRSNHYLNDGSGRLTTAGAGIDGNTLFATGGNNGITLGASQIPTITSSGTITVNSTGFVPQIANNVWTAAAFQSGATIVIPYTNGVNQTITGVSSFSGSNTMTYSNSSQAVVNNADPGIVGGMRFIRAG